MGYRKDIKKATRDISELLAEVEEYTRLENWERVRYLADTLYSRAYDMTTAADSKASSDN